MTSFTRGLATMASIIIALGGSKSVASAFQESSFKSTIDQFSATPEHNDAVAFRVILRLANGGGPSSALGAMITLTDGDLDAIAAYEHKRKLFAASQKTAVCTGLSTTPTDQEVVSVGARIDQAIDQEDIAHAANYRELLVRLSPTGADSIRNYVSTYVTPAFTTTRVRFAELFAFDPGAFRSNVASICHPNAEPAKGGLR